VYKQNAYAFEDLKI